MRTKIKPESFHHPISKSRLKIIYLNSERCVIKYETNNRERNNGILRILVAKKSEKKEFSSYTIPISRRPTVYSVKVDQNSNNLQYLNTNSRKLIERPYLPQKSHQQKRNNKVKNPSGRKKILSFQTACLKQASMFSKKIANNPAKSESFTSLDSVTTTSSIAAWIDERNRKRSRSLEFLNLCHAF